MSPQLIIAAIIATASFGGGFASAWKIQNGITAEKENQHVQQTLRATQESARTAIRRADNVIAAQNAAVVRERALRTELDHLHLVSDGLRDQSAEAARRLAAAPPAAVLEYATALGIVFEDCRAAYGGMAEKASRHSADVELMLQAWPSAAK